MTRRLTLAVAALVLLALGVALAGALTGWLNRPPSRVAISAVTVRGEHELFAVGGTGLMEGEGVIARSSNDGVDWTVFRVPVPVLTRVASAGDRLVASRYCLPPSAGGQPLAPAPSSCLFASEDGGTTWRDLGAGTLVDPTFVDASYGWAHAQFPTGRGLYESLDGGLSWSELDTPCPPEKPMLYSAVTTGRQAGYVICFGPAVGNGQSWSLIERSASGEIQIRYEGRAGGGEPRQGLKDDFVQGFSIGADGSGLIWASHGLHKTIDGGRSWNEVPVTGVERGSFWGGGAVLDTENAYLVRRTGQNAVIEYRSGTFRTLISWPIPMGCPVLFCL